MRRTTRAAVLAAALVFVALGCADRETVDRCSGPEPLPAPVLDPVASPTRFATALLSGTAAPGASVTVTGSAQASTTADAQGLFSVSLALDTAPAAETLNTLQVVYQTAEAASDPSFALILHDPVPPAPPSLDPLASPTTQASVTLSGATEPHATLTASGGFAAATAPADGSGAFSFAYDLLPNQTTSLSVTATDLAGNTSSAATALVAHDDVAPAAPDTSRIRAWFDGADIHVEGGYAAVEGGVSVTLTNTSTLASVTLAAQSNGMFATLLPGGADGQDVAVSLSDAAGNASPPPDPTVTAGLAWTDVNEAAPPAGRYGATLTLDIRNNRLLLFGGRDAAGAVSDTAWSLDLTAGSEAWTQVTASGGPGPRWGHSAVFEPMNQQVIIFGGEDGTSRFQDVWALDVSTPGSEAWTQVTPTGTPPAARSGHAAVMNQWNGEMVVYGGTDGSQTFDELWGCQVAEPLTPYWTLYPTSGPGPGGLRGHSAVVDLTSRSLRIFGGQNAGGGYSGTLYRLNLFTPYAWSVEAATGTPPPARARHAVFMDPVENRMAVFGGDSGTQRLTDLHFYLLGTRTWVQPSPDGSAPSARECAMAAFDTAHLRGFLFGGTSGGPTGAIGADLYSLD